MKEAVSWYHHLHGGYIVYCTISKSTTAFLYTHTQVLRFAAYRSTLLLRLPQMHLVKIDNVLFIDTIVVFIFLSLVCSGVVLRSHCFIGFIYHGFLSISLLSCRYRSRLDVLLGFFLCSSFSLSSVHHLPLNLFPYLFLPPYVLCLFFPWYLERTPPAISNKDFWHMYQLEYYNKSHNASLVKSKCFELLLDTRTSILSVCQTG